MNEKIKVLVVDDESDIFKLYEIFLKKEIKNGVIELIPFEDGESCMEYFRSHSELDLKHLVVFSDINMPQMNGYDLLREIKALNDAIEVFMVTAYGRDDYRQKAIDLGAEDLISKPVDFEAIKKIIYEHVD